MQGALSHYLPPTAVSYCFDLWQAHPFTFKITRHRRTKSGDYRFDPATKRSTISVNGSLNAFEFLVTYLHEVAHLLTFHTHGRQVAPHGQEWKNTFKRLMAPMVNGHVFPEDVRQVLFKHLQNPKASYYADPQLVSVLRRYGKVNLSDKASLIELSQGDVFKFKRKLFRVEKIRRTRMLCLDLRSKKKFLIHQSAEVEKIAT